MEKKNLRIFAVAFAFLCLMWGLKARAAGNAASLWFFGISGLSVLSAIFYPNAIKPVHFLFKTVFHFIMSITTVLVLGFVFYFVLTPIGILFRIFGKDLLRIKIRTGEKSYWVPKEKKPFDPKRYENQF